jgi:hypothetical protein
MMDDDECGAVGAIIRRGNKVIGEKLLRSALSNTNLT